MTLNAGKIKSSGGNFKVLDPGTYPARLVQLIDLGLQPQEYQGEKKAPKNEIMVTYELLDEFMTDEEGNELQDKPLWKSETFALNSLESDRAKSTQRYLAMDSSLEHGGDWVKLIGSPCMVTIVHRVKKDKTYDNVASVSSMRDKEAKKAPDLVNEPRVFDLDSPDEELFNSLPDWIKEKINNRLDTDGEDIGTTEAAEETTEEENTDW